MDRIDQDFAAFQAARQVRRATEDWLAAFEAALGARDAARLGALFHAEAQWRDILAFTWHFTPTGGREAVAARLAGAQAEIGAHGFHLPPDRRAPKQVTRLGVESVEAIFGFQTVHGRGAGLLRLAPEDGAMRAWHISTTLEALEGWEEQVGENRPTGAAYSRNFGGDNWAEAH